MVLVGPQQRSGRQAPSNFASFMRPLAHQRLDGEHHPRQGEITQLKEKPATPKA